MKKVLLFGASGQVGNALQERLAAAGVEFVAPPRDAADLTNASSLRKVIAAAEPHVIINAAAYTAVDRAESEPDMAHAANAAAPGVIAEEARRLGALLVHYSTDYVFNGRARAPYRESDPVDPVNVYGRTKLAGERSVIDSGARHLVLRVAWVYSARGRNFYRTVLRLAGEGKPLRVVDDQIGVPTSATAIAQVTIGALNQGLEGLYHYAPAGETSWFGFARAIVTSKDLGVPVEPITTADYPTPAQRPPYSVLCADALRHHLPDIGRPWQELLEAEVARDT